MHLGRLLSTIVAGLTLAQATPIQDRSPASSTSENAAAAAERKEARSQPAKYFREASFSPRYDARFATKPLNETAERDALKALVQTYFATLRDLGVQTWLMHGSLLGWWWNKQILPWDSTADVQITEDGINFLAAYYNMTTYYYKYPSVPEGRFFQLEVNPNYVHRGQDAFDEGNVADARWIDMDNGLFIDVTAVRYVEDHPEGAGVLASKGGHEFRDTYLYPLLDTTFEGVNAKIPYKYKEMLIAEYGEKALTDREFKNHKFVDDKMEWVPNDEL
ncbi:mannosylphosphorylation protein [Colletotrichum tofieldiae]|uniref:Mannosylphosphorylation protein n=1 Tax=Colletotrichum tofieldiae TaxID=708197 RepID=A0A161YPB5_9PEZI|nr:mannosylphosphorylation protein [Colletotrichum tofieldiae]GKT64725.1 mannosylphosphorylation protein [Colletotrichum tofieldiae]GKT74699.1 mannosylphosphorylation protein [Colletotrichum tofieldiae]